MERMGGSPVGNWSGFQRRHALSVLCREAFVTVHLALIRLEFSMELSYSEIEKFYGDWGPSSGCCRVMWQGVFCQLFMQSGVGELV